MLFAALRASLKNPVASAYIMTGSDIFLVNKAVEFILAAGGVESLNTVRMEEDAREDEINAALQNISIFGGNTAVVIRGADTRVYLKPCKPKDMVKVDCNPMTEDLVVKMILQNKRFTHDAAYTLARVCEYNYASVSNEMQKLLAIYADKAAIDSADIDSVVTKTEKYQVYELSDAALKKDAARVNKILETLLTGTDEYAVFGYLVSFARRLFYVTCSSTPDGELAKQLGVHPYALIAIRRNAKHITRERAVQIYEQALDLEFAIKSGKIQINRAVILLVGALI